MNQSDRPQSRPLALWGLFFLSGAAALGYQILWAKMFALTLGHEFPAVIAVIAVFFVGMALGGAFANKILARLAPNSFARLELIIGAWGLLTPLLIFKLGASWIAVLAVLPSTIAMGSTLPAMAALARIPSAYAANTFGAVVGCLATAYLLMPRFGFLLPIYICAACNFAAAFLARRFAGKPENSAPAISRRLAVMFFSTGFLALAFEGMGVRLLSQSLENTVFTFAAILAVYLLGQAAGAALIRVRVDILLPLLSGAVGLSTWIFASSGTVYETMRHSFGDSASAVACAEILTAFAVFALPTLLMGALFAQLADRAGERSLGRALLWNSLGAAVGAVVVPTVLFPKIGAFTTLALIAMSYVVFVQKWSVASIAAVVAALALIGFAPRPLTLAHVPPGSVLREIRSGRMATVTVAESPDGNRTLFVNNRFQMGGTAAAIPELRHGHIPLLLHPAPHRALFLGLGTGITISSAAAHPDLRADGVELLPEVVAVMPHFFPNAADSPLHATNISIHVADARRFIRETTNRYDVIVADLFHPAQDGAAFLYTREHFLRIRERLADDGLFCQWLPLHQLDLQTFRDITRTFMAVFPNAEAWLLRFNIDAPVVGLIGWKGSRPALTTNWVEPRATSAVLGRQLRRVALADSIRLFGSYLAGSDSLRAFGGDGPVNLDTFPIVMFEAPAFSYQRKAPTHERLLALIRQIPQRSPAIANPALAEKVSRYIAARDVYLNGLVAESSGDRVTALDDYIESARLSEEFTSGYAQCLAIASAESKTKPEETRKLLRRLVEAQPNRPVAKEMLERLSR